MVTKLGEGGKALVAGPLKKIFFLRLPSGDSHKVRESVQRTASEIIKMNKLRHGSSKV